MKKKGSRCMVAALMSLALLGASSGAVQAEQTGSAELAATVNGEEISAETVENYKEYLYVYYQNLYSPSTEEEDEALKEMAEESALPILIQLEVVNQKASELGLDDFTDAEKAEYLAQAADEWSATITYYKFYFEENYDMSEEEALEAAETLASMYGYESAEVLADGYMLQEVYNRVEELAVEGITVTDNDIEQAYETFVEEDEAVYKDDVAAYESLLYEYQGICFYIPEGYRHILYIQCEDMDEAEEIEERLEAGELFTDLMEELGFDPDTQCVDIHAESIAAEEVIIDAVQKMEQIGDFSQPVEASDGVYLLCYDSDVPAGPLELTDSVREMIEEFLYEVAKEDAVASLVEEWVAESEIIEY